MKSSYAIAIIVCGEYLIHTALAFVIMYVATLLQVQTLGKVISLAILFIWIVITMRYSLISYFYRKLTKGGQYE
jgi:hypothetical protein